MRHVEWLTPAPASLGSPGQLSAGVVSPLRRGNVYHGTFLIDLGAHRDCSEAGHAMLNDLEQMLADAGFKDIMVFYGALGETPRTIEFRPPTVTWSGDIPIDIDLSKCVVRFEAVWNRGDFAVPTTYFLTTQEAGLLSLWDASDGYQLVFDSGPIGWKLYELRDGKWTLTSEQEITELQARYEITQADPSEFYAYGPADSVEPSRVFGGGDIWMQFDRMPEWMGFRLIAGKGWKPEGNRLKGSEAIVRAIVRQLSSNMPTGTVAIGYGLPDSNEPSVVYTGTEFVDNPPGSPVFVRETAIPTGVPNQFTDLPFPTPGMPGVDTAIATQAMDAIRKAALACPQLALPGGALQNAGIVFGVFASTAASNGLDQQKSLDVLLAELDRVCPDWRGKDLGTTPSPPPELPAGAESVAMVLGQLASAIASGAINELPTLAGQARTLNLPELAQAIEDYLAQTTVATNEPPPPPPEPPPPPTEEPPPPPPPPEEPPPLTTKKRKKKGVSGGAIAVGVALTALAAVALSS